MFLSRFFKSKRASLTERRYRHLFENSADPIMIIKNGQIMECNQAAVSILGFTDKDVLLNKHPSEISPEYQPDGQLSVEKANGILAMAAEKRYQRFEWTHVRVDGTTFPSEVSLTAISDESGVTLHGTVRDISERKQLEKELRHSQKMDAIGKLAGSIAHDFNNQLVPILGYSEMLAGACEDDPELRDWIAEIHRAASFASTLVNKLSAFGRKDALQPVVLDIDKAVTELSGIVIKLIGQGITVDIEAAGEPLWIEAGPGDIEQIVLNLASNSRDAVSEVGKIKISLSRVRELDDDFASLKVSDNGIGMDAETLQRIYEPFFTTKELGSGTGLGMSTVKGLVQKAAGQIRAKSTPDVGTTIEVLFPIVETDKVNKANLAAEEPGYGNGPVVAKQSHILVVEDDTQIALFINRVLQKHGYRVTEASNGSEALEILKTVSPDLILTDVAMNKMSGTVMVKQLNEEGSSIPVVFISGCTDDRLAAEGFDIENIALLHKPFSPALLVSHIDRALAIMPNATSP